MPHTAHSSDPIQTPFHIEDEATYQAWRDQKLADYPTSIDELLVPVKDPRHLTPEE